ncbi:hypothetical protein EV368DRAFT_69802 [Lentinula lateritia]|nr:hypothetical protein EV368DRAFT_69802 [Lentinula lateritia]
MSESKHDILLGLSPRLAKRVALDKTKERLTRSLGPGGYLNSQTTDTQYFNFSESQSSGIPVYCEEESQAHFGSADNDWYNEESQIPDWSHDNESQNLNKSTSADESEIKAETPINPASIASFISVPSDQWGPGTENQRKLEEILAKNHGNDDFVYNLIAQREDCDLVRENFRVLRKDNEKAEFSRKANVFLLRKAGIPTDLYRSQNPLRRGHLVVGFHMLQIAFELIRHGGQAHDMTYMKDLVADGRVM